MPVIIDTTAPDLNNEIKQAQNVISAQQQVDAKYFSKNMTGNGKRKGGLFSIDTDTINAFMKDKRRLLDNVGLNEAGDKARSRHKDQIFGNFFHQSTKQTDIQYKKFENNLTGMIPPVILFDVLTCGDDIAMTFPRQSGMYNLNAFQTIWEPVTSGTINGKPATTYARPVIQSMRLYSREQPRTTKSGDLGKETSVAGQADIYVLFATVLDDMAKDGDLIFTNERSKSVNENQGVVSMYPLGENNNSSYNYNELNRQMQDHLALIHNANKSMPNISTHDLSLLIGDQSITDILKTQATTMTHQAKDTLLTFIQTFARRASELAAKNSKYPGAKQPIENGLVTFVQHIDLLNEIEDDLVTTDLLAEIYQSLRNEMTDTLELNRIARQSLRLLLSKRLHELNEIRKAGGLYQFEPTDDAVHQAMEQNGNYSVQQKRIITTVDPLVIGQAGAGSGKSHTLGGRINYMKDQGEDLSKVLVLSFTNVSAINITNRFPGTRSETLANMFHTIYSGTFPGQSLSQPSTVANSIRLLNPKSQYFKNFGFNEDELTEFIEEFAIRLEQFDQTGFKRVNLQQELKRLSNLIEGNLLMTEHVLNAVEQTTLELEPIIIHHMLLGGTDTLNIPDAYRNLNYIITDESQDISTFEYILLLELTIHYRSQLLIIGDGSQTLYEFRNSDPRYMNALESSNVFVSHKLETNYRSQEEILMFANQFLQVIDANKYANIQLSSSQFSAPTPQSVKDAIQVANVGVHGTSSKAYNENLVDFLENDKEFQNWFIDRVKRGEQVAIMGWTRKEVLLAGEFIEDLLKQNGLSTPVTNIMSNNERPMILLSRFARSKNETLRSLDPTHPNYLKELERHADAFVDQAFKTSSTAQSNFFKSFIVRNIQEVLKTPEWRSWIADFQAKRINTYQIGSCLIQQLLRIETRKNAMDQFLRKQKDVPNYDECPIILSTIHGTKGLEFDHTVILFNETKRGATSQESLRMMFVALSRAKKSEFIVNSHSLAASRVVSDMLSSMHQTPMETAMLRTLKDAEKLVAANTGAQTGPGVLPTISVDDAAAELAVDDTNDERVLVHAGGIDDDSDN